MYRDKHADELRTCFRKNGVGFKTEQDVVWLKDKLPKGVGATKFPSGKQIKNRYS